MKDNSRFPFHVLSLAFAFLNVLSIIQWDRAKHRAEALAREATKKGLELEELQRKAREGSPCAAVSYIYFPDGVITVTRDGGGS